MKQVTLSKRDIKSLNQDISKRYGIDDFFSQGEFVTLAEDTYILKDGELYFFYKEDILLPCLRQLLKDNFLKTVAINMGAVKAISGGADVMRPGIVGVDAYVEEGDIVAIVDENNAKPLAVGQSLFSKDEMIDLEVGKMVLNLHHVGDEAWNFTTESA